MVRDRKVLLGHKVRGQRRKDQGYNERLVGDRFGYCKPDGATLDYDCKKDRLGSAIAIQ